MQNKSSYGGASGRPLAHGLDAVNK